MIRFALLFQVVLLTSSRRGADGAGAGIGDGTGDGGADGRKAMISWCSARALCN